MVFLLKHFYGVITKYICTDIRYKYVKYKIKIFVIVIKIYHFLYIRETTTAAILISFRMYYFPSDIISTDTTELYIVYRSVIDTMITDTWHTFNIVIIWPLILHYEQILFLLTISFFFFHIYSSKYIWHNFEYFI